MTTRGVDRRAVSARLAALACLVFLIAARSPRSSDSEAIWRIRILEPASGVVQVEGTIPAVALGGRPGVDLRLPDLARRPQALQVATARLGDRSVAVERRAPDLLRISLAGGGETLTVVLKIDPTFFPPGATHPSVADARARLTDSLGVLRTTGFLPQMPADLPFRVRFELPAGWIAVTPWKRDGEDYIVPPGGQSDVDYIGVGPFNVEIVDAGHSQLRVATLRANGVLSAERIGVLLAHYIERFGPPPRAGKQPLAAIVVPSSFMRGGAAGARSVVQPSAPEVLAHELFHWWNGGGRTHREATWFSEGFTEHFALDAAVKVGLLTAEEARACRADLDAEMRHLERDGGVALAEASRRYREDPRSRRLVYSKGALLALHWDRQLSAAGLQLDALVRKVLAHEGEHFGNDDLLAILRGEYGDRLTADFRKHVKTGGPLPELRLGHAEGDSGCARFTPGNPASDPGPRF